MSAHTPGPWTVNGKLNLGWRIDAVNDERVGVEFMMNPLAIAPNPANARLIAAAPEMLEALKELVGRRERVGATWQAEGLRGPDVMDGSDGRYARARDAIAKATGGES